MTATTHLATTDLATTDLAAAARAGTDERVTDRAVVLEPKRRRRWPLVALGAGLLLVGVACSSEEGSGDLVTISVEGLPFDEVTEVDVRAEFDVDIALDAAAPGEMKVVIDDNLAEYFEAKIDEGTLTLRMLNSVNGFDPTQTPRVTLTMPTLLDLSTTKSANGDVDISGPGADRVVTEHDGDGLLSIDGVIVASS